MQKITLGEGQPGNTLTIGQKAEMLLEQRRTRAVLFAGYEDGFGEPAWDALLALFVAEAEGREYVPVDELVAGTRMPVEIARPYIQWLGSRHLAAFDGDRVEISALGEQLLVRYLDTVMLA